MAWGSLPRFSHAAWWNVFTFDTTRRAAAWRKGGHAAAKRRRTRASRRPMRPPKPPPVAMCPHTRPSEKCLLGPAGLLFWKAFFYRLRPPMILLSGIRPGSPADAEPAQHPKGGRLVYGSMPCIGPTRELEDRSVNGFAPWVVFPSENLKVNVGWLWSSKAEGTAFQPSVGNWSSVLKYMTSCCNCPVAE